MGFIYKVTNNQNGKIYIGKTTENVEKRFREHLQEAFTDNKNRPFHKAICKYGRESFSVETIEEVPNSILNEREIYWIDFFNSYVGAKDNKGYNATRGGEGSFVYDYSLIVEDYLKTQSKEQTAKNLNCCVETVRKACNEFRIDTFNNSCGVKIIRIDPNNKLLTKEYKSIKAAAEELAESLGKNAQTLRKRITYVIRHAPEQIAYGFYWKESN